MQKFVYAKIAQCTDYFNVKVLIDYHFSFIFSDHGQWSLKTFIKNAGSLKYISALNFKI